VGRGSCALNVAYVLERFLNIWCKSLVDVFAEAALVTVLGQNSSRGDGCWRGHWRRC
jgi:hypothetical protein